ncbi:hypothetical protein NMG60_11023646 [Bertholletia excelsa]
MAPNLDQVLSTLLFLFIFLNFPAVPTSQECPYPCYPPPTGPGSGTGSSSQTGSYPPPALYSPPGGYLPNSPPNYGIVPPPPDAIVPWFPFYYRKPPNQLDKSSAFAVGGSTVVTAVTHFLGFLLFINI